MKSKIERLKDSINNIQEAIKYCLKDIEEKYYSNKIAKKDCLELINIFKDINLILNSLNKSTIYSNNKLDKIRELNLTIMNLYEDGDYKELYSEIDRTNNKLCGEQKETDRKRLMEFKRKYKTLTSLYQDKLRKADNSSTSLVFKDKGLDNIKFFTENYLNLKYNFKKIKYKTANINELDMFKIKVCDKVIESNSYNDITRNNYSNLKELITEYAKADVIIDYLERIMLLCNQKEYSNIKEKARLLIRKYQKIYKNNKEKCTELMNQLNERNVGINSIIDMNKELKKELLEIAALYDNVLDNTERKTVIK